ncbi:MAG: hypothetical protein ACUVV4_05645 [Candidatus Bathyarchaeia archaeon]
MDRGKTAETLLDLVKGRYSSLLDPKGLEEVRKGVEAIAEAVEAMKTVKLESLDEPYTVFKSFKIED